jgi:hypothetical protein
MIRLVHLWRIRPLLLLIVRRNRLVVRSVLLRIVRTPRPLIVWTATIRLVHLWRIGPLLLLIIGWNRLVVRPVLLLLVVWRNGPSRRLPRQLAILAFIRIHAGLILIWLIALPLLNPALISRHGSSRIRTRRPDRWLIRLVVALLVLVPPRGRRLIRTLWTAAVRILMCRGRNHCTSRQWPLRRRLPHRSCNRYCSRSSSNLLPALVDQHRPLNLCRNVRHRASNDRPLRRYYLRLRNRPELLHLSRIDPHRHITHSASRRKVVPPHRRYMSPVHVVNICHIRDVHHVHVGSFHMYPTRFANIRNVYLVDIAIAAPVPGPVSLSGTQREPCRK